MSLNDLVRSIARTVTDRDQLKEKVKDLPLFVIQTTLSAAGQALMLADRVKNTIKGLAGKDEERESVAVAVEEEEEEKSARKKPVIFAPRPSAEENGAARKEPVIFSPKPQPKAEVSETAEANGSKAKVEPVILSPEPKPAAEPESAAEPKPAVEPEPAVEPVSLAEPAPAKAAPAKPARKPRKAASKAPAKAAEEGRLAEAVQAAPVEETPAPVPADLAEPLPGYAALSVASLRARLRGKSAGQIKDLLTYEQATSGRADVMRMYENRLAKLEAGE